MNWELSYPADCIKWDGKIISMRKEADIVSTFQKRKEAGIDWVMIPGLQHVEPADFEMNDGAKIIKRLLDETNLKVSSHHCVVYTFNDPDKGQEVCREHILKTVETNAILEPNAMVVHAGMAMAKYVNNGDLYSVYENYERRFGADALFEILVENIRFMGEEAAKCGMNVALENLSHFSPFSDREWLPKLVDEVDLPNVGYCIDTGHGHIFGETPREWLKAAGKKLFETHFHDNRALMANCSDVPRFVEDIKGVDEHLSPGFGTISWIDVIHTLDEIGFAGPICFEVVGWPGMDEVEGFKHAIAWWRCCEKLAEKKKK